MGNGRVLTESAWTELQTPDVYFTSAYHATSALADPDFTQSVLLQWTDNCGSVYLPLMLREIRGTSYFDATSAYGYGGPWVQGEPNLSAFHNFFNEWARDNSVVASFIRFHPLIENVKDFKEMWPVKQIGPTAVWELSKSTDLVDGMAKNHRKNWRRAVRSGVSAVVTESPVDVDGFRKLYERSMERLSARSSYWLDDAYWASLRDKLGENSLLVEAVHEDKVVAAAWCLFSSDYLHFHLSGTSDESRRLGGAYVCRVAAAHWAQDAGLSLAHHGGGVGGTQSSLLEWKRKFDDSAVLREFYVAEIIHDAEIFGELSGMFPENDYFPPWRDPSVAYASSH